MAWKCCAPIVVSFFVFFLDFSTFFLFFLFFFLYFPHCSVCRDGVLLLCLLFIVAMINFVPLFMWQNEKYTNKPHAKCLYHRCNFFFFICSSFSVVAALEKLGEYERTNSTAQCKLTYFVDFFSRHNSHPSFEWNETLPISNAQFIAEYIHQDRSWAHFHNMYMSGVRNESFSFCDPVLGKTRRKPKSHQMKF